MTRLTLITPLSAQDTGDALDLNAKARAEIMRRDWSAVHCAADR